MCSLSLNRPKSNDDEDFYYTDLDDEDEAIEMDPANSSPPLPPTLSHSDMARPPHEDPEYQRKIVGNIRQGLLMSSSGQTYVKSSVPMTGSNTVIHNYAAWSQTSPVSCANKKLVKRHSLYYPLLSEQQTSPQKHVRLSPRPSTSYAPYPSPTYSQANYPILVQQYHSMPSSQGSITKLSHSSPPQLPPPPQQNSAMLHTPTKMSSSCNKIRPGGIVSPGGRRTRGENKKCRKVYGMDNRDSWCTQCKWKKACSRFGD
jgi:hypothetical protein